MNIQKYIEEAHQIATEHGFHDSIESDYYWMMLIITEICEVISADRKNGNADGMECFIEREHVHPDFMERYDAYIKGTVAEELADICIRVFDFMGEKDFKQSDLNKTHLKLMPEFDNMSLIEQCYFVIGALTDCEDMIINCKNLLVISEHWAKQRNIDLEWHIRTKMEYNKLRPIYNGKRY